MKKIKSVPFRNLPKGAHYNYCVNVSEALSDAPAALLAVLGTLPAEFNKWLEEETALMSQVKKNVLTKKIETAGRRMDRALVALKSQVRALQLSLAPDIAETARRVYLMLRNYGWVYRKSYREKSGNIFIILEQFGGDYAADAAILGLTAAVSELQEAHAEFDSLLTLRSSESLLKPADNFRKVSYAIEKVYHQITVLVNSGAAVNISPAFAAFIDRLNPEIELLYNEFHRVRRKMRHAQPDTIPPQPYTGQPVTPTPAVYYILPDGKTVLLELGKDYNIFYRDNTKVGTARCIVRGKGLYTGNKMVTFVIV